VVVRTLQTLSAPSTTDKQLGYQADPYPHCIEAQTRWGINNVVHTTRAAYRIADIGTDNHTRTAADPRPQDLGNTSSTPAVTVRIN